MAQSSKNEIPLGLLLWRRIRQLGIGSIFGVPGDMNLELLDYIKDVEGLDWVGNANELNAAYAADGYSRVKDQPGVVVTTFGVGELSAINGIAGAYTENVKVIHIVGTTPIAAQKAKVMIHHCLGTSPDHRVYEKTSQYVRAAHCWLDNIENAPREIDRVIRECYIQSLPVYIFVPMDFVHQKVPSLLLDTPVSITPESDSRNVESALKDILDRLRSAKTLILIVDVLTARFGASKKARELADLLRCPTFATPMGKSIINETSDYYYGIYNGQISYDGVTALIEEESDLVLELGPLLSDSNTGGHSRKVSEKNLISIYPSSVIVAGKTYENVYIEQFLQDVVDGLKKSNLPQYRLSKIPPPPASSDSNGPHIAQSWVWKRLGRFLRSGDTIIVDSGTAQFGFPDAELTADIQYITQLYYGSIGYSVPACFGAAIARKEMDLPGRVVLLVGDGSLQLTVQEIGTMIRQALNIIIFVVNNDGYTIERAIHGPEEGYNDISSWNHSHMLSFFGLRDGANKTHQARTIKELDDILELPALTSPRSISVVEIFMDKMDIPWRLAGQIALVQGRQKQAAK